MIYARVTINGRRSEFSLGRRIDEQRWDSRGGRLRGTSIEVSNFNRFLDNVRNRLYDIYDSLLKDRQDISATIIKNIYIGKVGKEYMVLEIFQEHNTEIESLLGKGFTKGTLQRYRAAYKHVSAYIQANYHRNDIPVRRVDHKFIKGLEFFLKSQRNCEHNTAVIGGAIHLAKGEDVTVTIRFKDPDTLNSWRQNPKVTRVDLIMGEVIGPVSNRNSDNNPTTAVIKRFTESNWTVNGAFKEITYTISKLRKDSYVRIRGTNSNELEPKEDEKGESPWDELWFYSNPIFIDVE